MKLSINSPAAELASALRISLPVSRECLSLVVFIRITIPRNLVFCADFFGQLLQSFSTQELAFRLRLCRVVSIRGFH
jgi:hypothetical protein